MNLVLLKGRLGSDPEVRYTATGTAVAKFSLATSEKWKDKETTTWHNLVAWGKLAEICGKYLSKGQEAMFTGKITENSWEKDGVKHRRTEIVVDKMEFCGSKGGGQPAQPGGLQDDDLDIPF